MKYQLICLVFCSLLSLQGCVEKGVKVDEGAPIYQLKDTYLLNKNREQPYDLFFGGYRAPDGYDEKSGAFYQLVNAVELKEVVEEIKDEV